MRRLLLFVFCLSITTASYCGELVVSGFVYGYKKQPLILATVDLYFKGRSVNSTATDENGYFRFAHLTKGDSLVFSYIGYSFGTYSVKSSAFVEIGLERTPFVPSKSRIYGIVLEAKDTGKYHLYTNKPNNDKSPFLDLYHPEMRFTKVELGPDCNLKKLDSLLNESLAKSIKISGKNKIGFVIDKDGTLKSFIVLQSYQKEVDEEIFDLIAQNVKWFSARQNGQATSTYCELAFKISKQKINLIIDPS